MKRYSSSGRVGFDSASIGGGRAYSAQVRDSSGLSQAEIEEEARKFAVVANVPYDTALERLQKYYSEQSREPVRVSYYEKPDPKDKSKKICVIHKNKEIAEILASEDGKKPEDVKSQYAWESEDGGLTLLTVEELKEYYKKHPRFFDE